MYNFEIERIVQIIREKGYSRVSLQFPEGLRDYAVEIAEKIESSTNALVFISASPCYGACDLADEEAAKLGAEALFHFGHSRLLADTRISVHYIEVRLNYSFTELLEKNLERLPRKLGIVATVQHVQSIPEVKSFLEERGFDLRVGNGKGRCLYPGQVLGCCFAPARAVAGEVEAFLYLGTGDFHPLGVALATGKPTFALDPMLGELRDLEEKKNRFLRQRFGAIARAKSAESFGIIVGEKRGQQRLALAQRIYRKLKKLGKKAFIIHSREITPENFIYFRRLHALVNTACPRIAIEDSPRFPIPMLTPKELEVVLGEREEYEMDEF